MALGAKLEFVPAKRPEAIQMDISRYKVIKQKKLAAYNSTSKQSPKTRYAGDDNVTDNESDDSEDEDEDSEAFSEQEEDEFDSNDESDSSDSMEDSEKSDTEKSESEGSSDDDDEDVEFPTKAMTRTSSQPERNGKAAGKANEENETGEGLQGSHQFYDINENTNDRGTRPLKRIHKSWHPAARAPVGLVNRGVTCYMNAAVQAILHLPAVGRYLLEVLNGNHDKIGRSSVTYDFATLFKKMMEKKSPVFPSRLLRRLDDINPMLDEWQQEDSHEFYMSLISRLQEDSVPRGEKLRSSVIHDIFGGSAEQKVTCQRCMTVSTTTQDFYDLPVSFSQSESENHYTLEQSIRDFFTPEVISDTEKGTGYQCEKCRRRTKAVKQIAIADAPEYLTVHIKRFKMDGNMSKKVKDTMAYPLDLDLTRYETEQNTPLRYKLIAVIVHEGRTVSSGHYIALARQPSNDWVMYDDELMSKINESYVKSHPSAYILLYSRLSEKPGRKANGSSKIQESSLSNSEGTKVGRKTKTKINPKTKTEVPASKNSEIQPPSPKAAKKKAVKKQRILQKKPLKMLKPNKPAERRLSADAIDEIFGKSKKRKTN